MNQHKLRVFCEVIEQKSVTRAAERLMISQPVVSAHIRDLEGFFGAQLLVHRGRRMIATEAGELAYRCVVDSLRATEETIASIKALASGEAGRAVIGANMGAGTYFLPPLLARFKRANPLVEMALLISDSISVIEQTISGHNDFAVIGVLAAPRGLHAEVIHREPLVLVAAPGHHLTKRSTVSALELADEDFVCWPEDNSAGRVVDVGLREMGLVKRRVTMSLGHPEAIKCAVMNGIGIAMLYRSSVENEIVSGRLAAIPLDRELQHPFYLVHRPDRSFTPALQRLLTFIRTDPTSEPGGTVERGPIIDDNAMDGKNRHLPTPQVSTV